MKKRTLAILGASGILALGIAAPVTAYATGDKSTRHQELAAALAKELGVEESKVTAALDKVREEQKKNEQGERPTPADRTAALKERLATAVSEGKLTQAEADAVIKAYEAGVLGGFGHGHGGKPGGGPRGDQKPSS
ncbi:hypothetical protein [Allorhizocola rhizosphaerae]|uniref:hypothetical protein n=1 Tax=Allorhizocola rhizosphaerae TaxID=1872709 RepID=UPI001FEB2F5B|nr:hypothetical protein [Allorhizocola rhizosphaerae]